MTPRQHMLHEQNVHARFEDPLSDKEEDPEVEKSTATDAEAQRLPAHRESVRPAVFPGNMTDGPSDEKEKEPIPQASQPDTPTKGQSGRRRPKPTGLSMPPPPDLRGLNGPWDGTINGKRVPTIVLPPTQNFPNIAAPGAASSDANASVPHLHNLNSPYYLELEKNDNYLNHHTTPNAEVVEAKTTEQQDDLTRSTSVVSLPVSDLQSPVALETSRSPDDYIGHPKPARYTTNLRHAPPKSYVQVLKPWNGRLSKSKWYLVACRPFILFAYPSVLWSALVYSLSVGWLIVLSESITAIYKNRDTYNFTSLQAGLVYISPFIGGVLGTVVAGKVSDVIVRYMARRNGGVYEPEFRLVMGFPIAISTAIGLMGYGWSVEEHDNWIVPTVFFGLISFGCSLGSTTSITFCVDSYRQYAGEALVTLNFSKNIFHGLVFSLFFAQWLEDDGPRTTFLCIGAIQIVCLVSTIPMYIYGKRARMWTVRKAIMEKF